MIALLLLVLSSAEGLTAQDGLELFEKRVRPVLATECYSCHSAAQKKRKGNLVLDTPEGWLKGGRRGPAVVPGDPAASLLLKTVRHELPDLDMPKEGAKLAPSVVLDLETWIRLGAPSPAAAPPAPPVTWNDVLQQRKQWWSFQPLTAPPVPPGEGAPVDRFLKSPPADVDPRALLRRLHFVLVGLPPTPEEIDAFVANPDVAAAADRLLASPRFGERWARHWMDWLRYAETHGSEGDPAIPFAWRWRDYLVRALNADVPYPQLIREQLAGDLLENPRVEGDVVESALGPAHFRMVLHGFTPTDAHDEQATFVDNQIDAVTKAFLGLTVSCARCHDHKFDAISQADFTSLYGIFSSARPATIDVMTPARRDRDLPKADELRRKLRASLAELWLARAAAPPLDWPKARAESADRARKLRDFLAQPGAVRLDPKSWFRDGPGVRELRPAGELLLPPAGDVAVADLFPAGAVSAAYSDRHRGVVESPPFDVSGGTIWVLARGESGRARYVVRNYPRSGLIYPKADLKGGQDQWLKWNIDYWKGESVHLELGTSMDAPVETTGQERSWFVLRDALYAPTGSIAPPAPVVTLADLVDEPPADGGLQALRDCIVAWRDGMLSDAQADVLGGLVRKGALPVKLADLDPASAALVRELRAIDFPAPIRAPGLHEGFAADAPLYHRGDPHKPGPVVPRRYLEAFDPTPYRPGARSGRRELAESVAASTLAARVLVNRAWHHAFGQGLVSTPDNFGRLGEPPSNPELLDHLASEFIADGASIKRLLRRLVVTRAFRLAPMRRLEAEAIRDSMIALSGRLDPNLGGAPVEGDAPRRSLYVRVIRNSLDPLLSAFDYPVPSAPRGRRDATNVPAQALVLLNGGSVRRWAGEWAKRSEGLAPEARVRRLFLEAFSRPATEGEVAASLEFLGAAPDWASLAHALFNAKEFIHVR